MGTDEPEVLALRAVYGSLYNELIRPEQKYTISHYLRTQWAPLLGAARLWFVVALRQRCFWNERQEWCIADKKTLARESGLSLRTINRIVAAESEPQSAEERDGWTAWFFSKKRRRRYDGQIGRTVNAPNRYHVLLDDPLTPRHQAGLAHYLRQHTANGDALETLQALEALCALPDEARREVLESAPPGAQPPIPAAFVLDVVEANCPRPEQEQLKVDIARAALRLHQVITSPERVYIGTQYYRRQWLPRLGPVSALLVVNLRARCYWNERTGELRNTCRASWSELAAEVGCTARQLRYLRQDEALQRFVTVESEGHGAARSTFRVQVPDLLADEDAARFEQRLVQWAQGQPGFEVDPESGQIDARPLLLQAQAALAGRRDNAGRPIESIAEILAPGKPGGMDEARWDRRSQTEVLALATPDSQTGQKGDPFSGPSGQNDQAEVLAPGGSEEAAACDTERIYTTSDRTSPGEVLAPGRTESRHGSDVDGARIHSFPSQAEILASGPEGQAEVLAPGERKFWPLEGLQAEVLALEGGNFGTTGKLLFITLDPKGLSTAALALPPTLCADPEQLAAAARQLLLAHLGIEEPNRSRLARRRPACGQILAWGLYALTQRGLQNRAGYVYNRLLSGDLAPQEFVDLAGLPPPVWHALVSAVRERQEHLLPQSLYATFRKWWAALGPVWNEITCKVDCGSPLDLDALADEDELKDEGESGNELGQGHRIARQMARALERRNREDAIKEGEHETPPISVIASEAKQSPAIIDGTEGGQEGGHKAPPLQHLDAMDESETPPVPYQLRALLQHGETARWEDPGWLLITPSLLQARWLSSQVACEAPEFVVQIGVQDGEGQVHVIKAEFLALAAEAIPDLRWTQLQEALRLRMGQKVFDQWWPEVQPLGLAGGLGHDPPAVVFCVPNQDLRAYLAAHHTEVAEWACMSVLHHEVRISFITYDEPLPEPAPALT